MLAHASSFSFPFIPRLLKKRLKKNKIQKRGAGWEKFENGYLPPIDRAGGVGPETSRLSSGREVSKLLRGPSSGPFLIREEASEASRPPNGREIPPAYFFYFLLELIFYKLFKIHTFSNTRFISPYSFVDII
jgi:hypothetical protein